MNRARRAAGRRSSVSVGAVHDVRLRGPTSLTRILVSSAPKEKHDDIGVSSALAAVISLRRPTSCAPGAAAPTWEVLASAACGHRSVISVNGLTAPVAEHSYGADRGYITAGNRKSGSAGSTGDLQIRWTLCEGRGRSR
jgi:hypothetical protein